MSLFVSQVRSRLTRLGRVAGFLAFALLMGPLTGCTTFQSITTKDWFDGTFLIGESEPKVNHMFTYWDSRMRVAQDSVNNGQPLPCFVGRLYLLDEQRTVEAHGTLMVTMVDLTNANTGAPATKLAEWKFGPEGLKLLKSTDRVGQGYTIVLPWDEQAKRPDVKVVQLQICYMPKNGAPRYTEPQKLTLQAPDQQVVVTHGKEVPAVMQRQAREAAQAVPTPLETARPPMQIMPIVPPPVQQAGAVMNPAGPPLGQVSPPIIQAGSTQLPPPNSVKIIPALPPGVSATQVVSPTMNSQTQVQPQSPGMQIMKLQPATN